MEDIEATIRVLREIADLGVPIAVDDFGTGYSSLRYLAKLPVASLKVDRSFIMTMTTEADSMAIVSAKPRRDSMLPYGFREPHGPRRRGSARGAN